MKEKLFAHLLKEMNRVYGELYAAEEEGYITRDAYRGDVERFEQLLQDDPDTVRAFVRYREDPISSDREIAAFMGALDSL